MNPSDEIALWSHQDCSNLSDMPDRLRELLEAAAKQLELYNQDRGPKPNFQTRVRENVSAFCEARMRQELEIEE